MRYQLLLSAAVAAIVMPGAAYAQSTGTSDFEGDIVITASNQKGIDGVQVPDTPKTSQILTQEFISKQAAGQSIDEIINQMPGVSFQNQDPFGSSGGRLTIRGFGPDRISQTIDGVPVNDTGNYALYSNQQLDPELIDQVSVVFGSTDIDSPTASASGSTVNYRSIVPSDQFGARLMGSLGDFNFFRVFGLVNTGTFTPWGTKAWFSASKARNDVIFSNYGEIDKAAYNFKVYQPIGSNGDFISLSGNWNVNRNNNTPDFPLRFDKAVPNGFPATRDDRYFNSAPCQTAPARAGLVDTPNSCGTAFEQNVNPSNTGNLRLNSKFGLTNRLSLTFDGYFQYTKANGGSYGVKALEQASPVPAAGKTYPAAGLYGYINNVYYVGKDLNGDGDTLDTVEMDATSQTVTHRWSMTSSLRYDLTDTQSVRLIYSHDYGRHRQSGEMAPLLPNGQPVDVFPINIPVSAPNGELIEKRNRKSYAILDQAAAEYRGKFLDERLVVSAGARIPWFKRNLHNYCYTTSAAGFVDCVAGSDADNTAYQNSNPYVFTPGVGGAAPKVTGSALPQFRQFNYNKVLPSAGLTYKFDSGIQLYASYSKGLQVPGTDNLYQSFYYPIGVQDPVPEVTDNFDAGLRYTSPQLQAVVGGWYTIFTNRLAASYDPINDITTYRNLGKVDKYGIDGSVTYKPIPEVSLYVFGSAMKSRIRDNVLAGTCTAANIQFDTFDCGGKAVGDDAFYLTRGKREAGAPTYTFGGRAELNLKPIEFGVQAKRTGPRYVNDQNVPIYSANDIGNTTTTVLWGAKAPAYTVVDLDARVSMGWAGLNDKTYVQFNLLNVFDELYVGNLGNANTSYTSIPFVYAGPPRTFMVSLNMEF